MSNEACNKEAMRCFNVITLFHLLKLCLSKDIEFK